MKTWSSYASVAGIQDTTDFAQCVSNNNTFPRIERGRDAGAEAGVHGTPTVIINGWRFPIPPYDNLPTIIENLLAGRGPLEDIG